ncbi:hypothetical protein RSO41_12420 [Halomonas sp. I1]|nr:hypothetical protein [Halomonas sp. I1]MDT8895461.1 hypothetical protein [Halomonas sp. I1]
MSVAAWLCWFALGVLACLGLAVGNIWWMARHLDDQGEEIQEDRDAD